MDFVDALRTLNLILGTVLVTVCSMRLTRDWPKWSRRERVVRVHLVGYLTVVSIGSALLLADLSPEGRAGMLLVVHTSFALALWRNRKDPVR